MTNEEVLKIIGHDLERAAEKRRIDPRDIEDEYLRWAYVYACEAWEHYDEAMANFQDEVERVRLGPNV